MLQKKIKTPAEKTKETNDYATDKEKKRKKDQKETGLGIHRGPKTISAGGRPCGKKKSHVGAGRVAIDRKFRKLRSLVISVSGESAHLSRPGGLPLRLRPLPARDAPRLSLSEKFSLPRRLQYGTRPFSLLASLSSLSNRASSPHAPSRLAPDGPGVRCLTAAVATQIQHLWPPMELESKADVAPFPPSY